MTTPEKKPVVGKLKENYFAFWCPGCKGYHAYDTSPGLWTFNNDLINPTFSPSLLNHANGSSPRCHLFVRNGTIEFCGDCEHELKGKTITMEPYD